MLSGAGVIDSAAGEKIIHLTLDGTIKKVAGGDVIVVKAADFAGYSPIVDSTDYQIYGMVLDNEQVSVMDYLGSEEIESTEIAESATTATGVETGDLVITLKKSAGNTYNEHICRIDCYAYTTSAQVTTLTVDAENFGGTFYIEAETLFRDEATGHDFPATFIIPKGKIQGNFTFSMAATGDPSTFDFTVDCTLGSVRGSNKKVLYAIDIIDNISSSEAHSDAAENVDWSSDTATYGIRLTKNNTTITATAASGITSIKYDDGTINGVTLVSGTDYNTPTYTGSAGNYTGYTVTFKGDYVGTISGTISNS